MATVRRRFGCDDHGGSGDRAAGGAPISDYVELRVTRSIRIWIFVVHVGPAAAVRIAAAVQELGDAMKLKLHAIRIRDIDGHLYINFYVDCRRR